MPNELRYCKKSSIKDWKCPICDFGYYSDIYQTKIGIFGHYRGETTSYKCDGCSALFSSPVLFDKKSVKKTQDMVEAAIETRKQQT